MPATPSDDAVVEPVPADPTVADRPDASPWEDLDAYIATPRLGALTLSPDGRRLVVAVSRLDKERTSYVTALWSIDPAGEAPAHRLTRSLEGEAAAAFTRDGSLLFSSRRPVPKDDDDVKDTTSALWCLPEHGEAYPLARRDGGWGAVHAARDADRVLFEVSMHMGVADEAADKDKRAQRRDKKVAAILHEGYPVRHWDHDLGPEATRLLVADVAPDGEALPADSFRMVGGDLGRRVQSAFVSNDGALAAVTLQDQVAHGENWVSVGVVDLDSGELRVLLAADAEFEYAPEAFTHDGRRLVCAKLAQSSAEQVYDHTLVVVDLETAEQQPLAAGWDRWPTVVGLSPDDATLFVTADEDGAAPLFAIPLAGGEVRRVTQDHHFYGNAVLSPDGRTIYAVRTAYDNPGEVVAVDTASGDVRGLDSGVSYPALPGRLERFETTAADGTRVPGWLCLPADAGEDHPAPLTLFIHGGPVSSSNAWSWRWCPWLLVSQGYAVALPDPALSTGYGRDYVQRGWGRWGEEPYTDLMSYTDALIARDDIDAEHIAAMGGSFGGYMANWVAGHTDRFRAIVTHASLWNLESFGGTTDAAWFWHREMSPEMASANSPHRSVEQIRTPMLVIHGDKDYRVPIGEGLSLWWQLVSTWQGEPAEFPHKFLYYPDECHWILSPQHAAVWYETVRAFLDAHVWGRPFRRPELL